MAITNHERVGKAMDLLKDGLAPFVEREMKAQHCADYGLMQARDLGCRDRRRTCSAEKASTAVGCRRAALKSCGTSGTRSSARRSARRSAAWSANLRDVRNNGRTRRPFSSDDAYRALDSAGRLLTAVSAPQADEIEKMKMELLRLRFDEQVRSEKRKSAGTAIESAAAANLKPWREVVTPHKDVASGRYQQAEFAADLWQVHLGEGTDEYKKPVEFFRRTYLTESLKRMLVGAVQRISGKGGDPVVQLQTNFGGGKTHSMLALYHLFSGVDPERPGGHRRRDAGSGRQEAADRQARGAGGQQDLARQSRQEARWHRGAHPLGRAGLAARRKEGFRAHPGRR